MKRQNPEVQKVHCNHKKSLSNILPAEFKIHYNLIGYINGMRLMIL